MTLKERFYKYVEKTDKCWNWKGLCYSNGYGQLGIDNKTKLAHRISYELFNGPILNKMIVMHKCDNRKCVNPEHLLLGTHSENTQDMWNKNRSGRKFKINFEIAEEIRNKYIPRKYSQDKLAKEYGLKQQTVYEIVSNKIWRKNGK